MSLKRALADGGSTSGVRRRVDDRISMLLRTSMASNTRSFFVVVGARLKNTVLHLYNIRLRMGDERRASVCWCYRKQLVHHANKMKQMKRIAKLRKSGKYDDAEDPFWLFQQGTQVTYCKYNDTQRLLGNSFDILVLQDFHAITPTVLCKTIETVKGGGMVILLMHTEDPNCNANGSVIQSSIHDAHSAKLFLQLFSGRSMDKIKAHYNSSENEGEKSNLEERMGHAALPRYANRFARSLLQCENLLVVNEFLRILPTNGKMLVSSQQHRDAREHLKELRDLNATVSEQDLIKTENAALRSVLLKCISPSQVRALAQVVTLLRGPSETKELLNPVIAVVAARGRGKSALLGLSLALWLKLGCYKRVTVCTVVPENSATLFQFLEIGLVALGVNKSLIGESGGYTRATFHERHQNDVAVNLSDLESRIVVHSMRARGSAVAMIEYQREIASQSVTKHRVEYLDIKAAIRKSDRHDLLILDEAASIPASDLRKLMLSNCPILMATTTDGYEGTGLALTTLIFREIQMRRNLRLVKLTEPIRYSSNDPLENWLKHLFCLRAHE